MPKYCEYSKYEQYRIPIYVKNRQYSRVSNPKVFQVQRCSSVSNPKVQAVSRVFNPGILSTSSIYLIEYWPPRYLKYKQYLEYWTPKYLDPEMLELQAVSRVVLDPKILPVQEESEVLNLSTARMPSSITM